ncbi:MAG TPA: beta/gamma crystallin-related protein [Candidatus Nitrosotenuis sp.]|nr:beta/gamma crystallin-related protein [Candidatus Nitrosotenuis sp.]
MTVTLFKKDDFQGEQHTIINDISDLKNTPVKHNSSSMSITNDKVLLFTKNNYKGDAMFRTGTQDITKLSSKSKGGKSGFGNTILCQSNAIYHTIIRKYNSQRRWKLPGVSI